MGQSKRRCVILKSRSVAFCDRESVTVSLHLWSPFSVLVRLCIDADDVAGVYEHRYHTGRGGSVGDGAMRPSENNDANAPVDNGQVDYPEEEINPDDIPF